MAAADGQGLQDSIVDLAAIRANIHFLKRDVRYQKEKPYAFRYELDTKDIPQSNMEMEKVEGIQIRDIRGLEPQYSLDLHGFSVLRQESALEYGDYYNPNKVWIYLRELEGLLKTHLNASRVEVFRHGVRPC